MKPGFRIPSGRGKRHGNSSNVERAREQVAADRAQAKAIAAKILADEAADAKVIGDMLRKNRNEELGR